MKYNKWIILLGGAGFIGKGLTSRLLKEGHRVIIVTRDDSESRIRNEILVDLPYSAKTRLLIIGRVDIASMSINTVLDLPELLETGVGAVVNLATTSVGKRKKIIYDNKKTVLKVLTLVQKIKTIWPDVLFFQFGSITEYSKFRYPSSYRRAKKTVRKLVFNSGLCDFHIVFGFTYGGNQRMVNDFEKVLPFLLKYPSLLHGFQMACINIELLVERFVSFLAVATTIKKKNEDHEKTIEVRIIEKEMDLYELLGKCFGSSELQENNKCIFPRLERMLLLTNWLKFRLLSFDNPTRIRFSLFCLLGALAARPDKQLLLNHYLALGKAQSIRDWGEKKPADRIVSMKNGSKVIIRDDSIVLIV